MRVGKIVFNPENIILSHSQEKLDEYAQLLLRLRAKKPEAFRQIMALIKELLG